MNEDSPIRPLISASELAKRLGVTRRTISNYIAAGKIPVIRLSERCNRFAPEEVARALAVLQTTGGRK